MHFKYTEQLPLLPTLDKGDLSGAPRDRTNNTAGFCSMTWRFFMCKNSELSSAPSERTKNTDGVGAENWRFGMCKKAEFSSR